MRLWNFSNFEQFEEQVLVGDNNARPSAVPPKKKRRTPQGQRVYSSNSSLKLAIAFAAALAISIPVLTYGNTNVTQVPVGEITSPSINIATRPPLEVLFGGRFQGAWTREKEDRLLALAGDRASADSDTDRANFIHTAQQESLEDDVPRIQMNELPKIVRRKG